MSGFCEGLLRTYLMIPKPNVVIRIDTLYGRNGRLGHKPYDEL